MNKSSHVLIGQIIFKQLKREHNIHLCKESFIKGNVIPDSSYYAIVHPHFMKFSLEYIQSEIEKISCTYLNSAFVDSDYSYRLGIVCHYYADFFCHAHGSDYKQIVVNHLRYEHFLHEYFFEHFASIANIKLASFEDICRNAKKTNEQMLSLFNQYDGSEPSYDNDLVYALKACMGAVLSMVFCSLRQSAVKPLEVFCEAAAS